MQKSRILSALVAGTLLALIGGVAANAAPGRAPEKSGLGNNTAVNVGNAGLDGYWYELRNLVISHAELKNEQMDASSDVGEGRERADEVNDMGRYSDWSSDPSGQMDE